MDDSLVKNLAYAKTLNDVEDNKHKKVDKYLYAAVPFAAGISSALLKPAEMKFLNKNITGVAARILNGAKSTASWGMLFGLAGAITEGRNFLESKSPKFDKLTSQNPLMTFLGSVAAFAGTLALGAKAAPKVIEFASKHVDAKTVEKFSSRFAGATEKFNNNRVVKTVADAAKNVKDSKYLAPLKGVAKTLVSWAPMTLLWGGLIHDLNHKSVKRETFAKNYSEIKDYQHRLAKARIQELSLQNDFLMQDAKNREDLKLVKEPMSDIASDVE